MRIECIHGYFKFTEQSPGDLSRFVSMYELELGRAGDHFTFEDLIDAPRHSIAGGTFLGCPTLQTFEGEPWDVMRENDLVYNFQTGLVVPILTIIQTVSITPAGFYFVAPGMILPGSITDDGSRVTDYSAFFNSDRSTFKYSEIGYGEGLI